MTGHVEEHCKPPWTWFRRTGSVWACTCGKIYRMGYIEAAGSAIKSWMRVKVDND